MAGSRVPEWIAPMLATLASGPPGDDPRLSYEFKWDGYRACMRVAADGATVLTSRNNKDFNARFPELLGVFDFEGRAAVLDGEIVALDEQGRPDFGLLQNRLTTATPVSYFAFDLLRLGSELLVNEPYERRRALLEAIEVGDRNLAAIPPAYRHADLVAGGMTPQTLLDVAAERGLEGLVTKTRGSRYHPGRRSADWMKHPLIQTQEVVICGWRPGQGRITGSFGGLLLGAHHPISGELIYIGDVGTGFSDRARRELQGELERLEVPRSPFVAPIPRKDALRAHWVRPELVGEVVYRQFTRGEGRLRHTAWRGLRPDRDAEGITAPFFDA